MRTGKWLLWGVVAWSSVAFGQESWRAVAEVSPSQVLPGIPVNIVIRLTNVANEPQAAPPELMIVVSPAGRAPFVARCGVGLHRRIDDAAQHAAVLPRQEVTLALLTDGSFRRPDCLDDPRLHVPGTYSLSFRLGEHFNVISIDSSNEPLDIAQKYSVAAADATLVVLPPTGDDATVWALMNAAGLEPWSGPLAWHDRGQRLGDKVLREFPQSEYAGWFAATGIGATQNAKVDRLRRWLDATPRQPHHDARWSRVAEWELGLAGYYGSERPRERDHHARQALDAIRRVHKAAQRAELLEQIRSMAPTLVLDAAEERVP